MTRTPLVLALLSCAAAGCAAEATPAPPAVSAPPHHGPWQQFCEQAWNVPQASGLVAARGTEGWELVSMYNGVLCYKRPAPDFQPAAPRAPGFGAPGFGTGTPGTSAAPGGAVPMVRDPGF
jgi:hypothetical protein